MVNFQTLAIMGLASAASALEAGLARWSQTGCPDAHHIGDGHVKQGQCKTFSSKEPLFYSFLLWPEKDAYDIEKRLCQLTVYQMPNCEGQGFSFGDIQPNLDRCASIHTGGRSVFLSCASRVDPKVGLQPPGTVQGPADKISTVYMPGKTVSVQGKTVSVPGKTVSVPAKQPSPSIKTVYIAPGLPTAEEEASATETVNETSTSATVTAVEVPEVSESTSATTTTFA